MQTKTGKHSGIVITAWISRPVTAIHLDPVILGVNAYYGGKAIEKFFLATGFYLYEFFRDIWTSLPRLGDLTRVKLYYKPSGSKFHVADIKPLAIIHSCPALLGDRTPRFKMSEARELLNILLARGWVREKSRADKEKTRIRAAKVKQLIGEHGYYSQRVDRLVDTLTGTLGITGVPRDVAEEILIGLLWGLVHSDVWEDEIVVIGEIEDPVVLERIDDEIEKMVNGEETLLTIYRNTHHYNKWGNKEVTVAVYVPTRRHSLLELFPTTDGKVRRGYTAHAVG